MEPAPAALVAPQLAAQLRALVFTLVSPEARDDILRRTPGLKDLNCPAIFGAGGEAKLSVKGVIDLLDQNHLKKYNKI